MNETIYRERERERVYTKKFKRKLKIFSFNTFKALFLLLLVVGLTPSFNLLSNNSTSIEANAETQGTVTSKTGFSNPHENFYDIYWDEEKGKVHWRRSAGSFDVWEGGIWSDSLSMSFTIGEKIEFVSAKDPSITSEHTWTCTSSAYDLGLRPVPGEETTHYYLGVVFQHGGYGSAVQEHFAPFYKLAYADKTQIMYSEIQSTYSSSGNYFQTITSYGKVLAPIITATSYDGTDNPGIMLGDAIPGIASTDGVTAESGITNTKFNNYGGAYSGTVAISDDAGLSGSTANAVGLFTQTLKAVDTTDSTESTTTRIIKVSTSTQPTLSLYYNGTTTAYGGEWLSTDPSADADRQRTLDVVATTTDPGTYDIALWNGAGVSAFTSTTLGSDSITGNVSGNPASYTYSGYSTGDTGVAGTDFKSGLTATGDPTNALSPENGPLKAYFDSTVPTSSVTVSGSGTPLISVTDSSTDTGSGVSAVYVKAVPAGSAAPSWSDADWILVTPGASDESVSFPIAGTCDIYTYTVDNATNKTTPAIASGGTGVLMLETAPTIEVYYGGTNEVYGGEWISTNTAIADNAYSGLDTKATSTVGGTFDFVSWLDDAAYSSTSTKLGTITSITGNVTGTTVNNNSSNYNTETPASGVTPRSGLVSTGTDTAWSTVATGTTMKIDNSAPTTNFAVGGDKTTTMTVIDSSTDALSGIEGTYVMVVSAGSPVPAYSDTGWVDSASFVSPSSGIYDVYVYSKDNATNKSTITPAATGITILSVDPDLTITKSIDDSLKEVMIGNSISYTITVSNSATGSPATNYFVLDDVPTNITVLSTTPTATVTGNHVEWSGISIATGATVSFKITGRVDAAGSLKNIATVYSPDATDPTKPGSEKGRAETDSADGIAPTVSKIADKSTIIVGEDLTYTIVVDNSKATSAANGSYFVVDTLPSTLTYKSSSPSATVSGQTLTWSVDLAAGDVKTFTVLATATAQGDSKNTAEVYTPDPTDNTKPGTKFAEAETDSIPTHDVGLTKSVDKTSINTGEEVTFTIKVDNTKPGAIAMNNYYLADELPSIFEYVSGTPGANIDGGSITWTINVAANSTETLTLTAKGITEGSEINTAYLVAPNASASGASLSSIGDVASLSSTGDTASLAATPQQLGAVVATAAAPAVVVSNPPAEASLAEDPQGEFLPITGDSILLITMLLAIIAASCTLAVYSRRKNNVEIPRGKHVK